MIGSNKKKTPHSKSIRVSCLGACGRSVDLHRRMVRKTTQPAGYCRKCQRARERLELRKAKRIERAEHPKPYKRAAVKHDT